MSHSIQIPNSPHGVHYFNKRSKVNSIIFDRFFAADYDPVLEFFPPRQDFEIIGLLSIKNSVYCNI
jgi:hypothetical protein